MGSAKGDEKPAPEAEMQSVADRIAAMKEQKSSFNGDKDSEAKSTLGAKKKTVAERIASMKEQKSTPDGEATSRPTSTASTSSKSSSIADKIAAMKKKSQESSTTTAPSSSSIGSASSSTGSIADRIAKMKAGGSDIKVGPMPVIPPSNVTRSSGDSASSASSNGVMNPDEPPKPRKRSITVTETPSILPIKTEANPDDLARSTSAISEGDERDSDISRPSSLTTSTQNSPQVRTLKKIHGDKDPNMHVINDDRLSVGSSQASVKSSATGKISALAKNLGGLDMKMMLGGPRGPPKGGIGMPGMMAMPGMTPGGGVPPALMKKRFEFNTDDEKPAGEVRAGRGEGAGWAG
jgi:hypothetical protein